MMREVLAYDLELYAINTGQLYQTHKSLARRKQNAWAWIMHVRDNVIPRYSREIEPVWASAETIDAVAVALMEYYARHVIESEQAKAALKQSCLCGAAQHGEWTAGVHHQKHRCARVV